MPRKRTLGNRLRADLRAVAPDLLESCVVHLATVDELTQVIDAELADGGTPAATLFQRRTEAANFITTLIERRKAEGRASSDKHEAAKLLVRAIYDPDFEWRPHDGAEDEDEEES